MQTKSIEPFIGKLIGNHVIVEDASLYALGIFGKGELSRSKPIFKTWYDTIIASTDASDNISSVDFTFQEEVKEHTVLSLQEAFYLYFALGSIRISVEGEVKPIQDCFKLFCEIEGNEFFISRYAIYHYFRCRGWITRTGSKYGCDYVLYKENPEYEHAQYGVSIVSSNNLQSMTWKELQHHCRISVNVKKDLIICQYKIIGDLDNSKNITDILNNSITLSTMKVTRFVPEKDREAED